MAVVTQNAVTSHDGQGGTWSVSFTFEDTTGLIASASVTNTLQETMEWFVGDGSTQTDDVYDSGPIVPPYGPDTEVILTVPVLFMFMTSHGWRPYHFHYLSV